MVEQTTQGAISPVDRAHPARPLHRGHLPDLLLPRGPRRPVRQLRQPARPHRPDQPAQSKINGETPEFIETQHFFLDLPALADALREWLEGREAIGHLAAQRHQVQPQHPRRHPPAGDDPRHRLGHPGAARRLARPPDQAALRLVRRGRRLPVGLGRVGAPHRRPRALARVVERPRGRVLLLHGQGQHHLPLPDLAGRAARVCRSREPRRRARRVRRAQPAHRGRVERVPHDGGQAVLDLARLRHPHPRRARALRPRRASATSSARPARRTRTPTSPGPSSSSATTPSSSPAGATSSTARRPWSPRTSARSRSRARSSRSTRRCAPRCSRRSTPWATCWRSQRIKAAVAEAMRDGRRGEQVRHRHRAVQAQGRGPARAAGHGAAHRSCSA